MKNATKKAAKKAPAKKAATQEEEVSELIPKGIAAYKVPHGPG